MSLDLRTGKPVWLINKPRIATHKKLAQNIRSEIVVVGGGISGALIAHRLTNLGMQVTMIDGRKFGAGSTAASTAILSYELLCPEKSFRRAMSAPSSGRMYMRTTVDSRLIVGGEDVDFIDEAGRDRLLASKVRILERKSRKMFPHISWKLAAAWTGTFAESKDGLPYIGPHKSYPGAQFAFGYGGNGITFAALASLIIPDLISGAKNRDAHLFRFGSDSK